MYSLSRYNQNMLKNKRIHYLNRVIQEAEKRIAELPEGTLYPFACKGKVYYRVGLSDASGRVQKQYLHQSAPKELKIARELASKEYLQELKEACEAEIKAITLSENNQKFIRAEDVYGDLNPAIRDLTTPLMQNDDEYARAWENANFPQKPIDERHKHRTDKGELVQSKSELTIANILFSMGIPYRYECALKISDEITIYPDFTILKKSTREIFYHEHCGMMDRAWYVDKLSWRFNQYAKIGIYNGCGMSISVEDESGGVDASVLRQQFGALYL